MSNKVIHAIYDDDDVLLHAVKDVKAAQHEFILFLNELVEKFYILLLCKVVPGQAVHEL